MEKMVKKINKMNRYDNLSLWVSVYVMPILFILSMIYLYVTKPPDVVHDDKIYWFGVISNALYFASGIAFVIILPIVYFW